MNFGAKFSTDIQIQQWLRMDHTPGAGNWITVITERSIWTHFDGLMTRPDLLPTFYDFLSYQKSKIHLFKNLNKNVNTYILEQWWPVASGHIGLHMAPLLVLSAMHRYIYPHLQLNWWCTCSTLLPLSSDSAGKWTILMSLSLAGDLFTRNSSESDSSTATTTLTSYVQRVSQWSFPKTRTVGINAGEPSGNWCLVQAPELGASAEVQDGCVITSGKILRLYMQNRAI